MVIAKNALWKYFINVTGYVNSSYNIAEVYVNKREVVLIHAHTHNSE